MTARYLVTGGAGFVGVHLVERLLLEGHAVTVIDDFSNSEVGPLAGLADYGRLRLVEGDIGDRASLASAIAGSDGVFHLAAKTSVPDCIEDWIGNHGVNATNSLKLFDLVRSTRRVPVVFASSAAVYGDRSAQKCNEHMAGRPISPYGADKLACEHHARAFWAVHGIPSVGLRFFNIYGPGQPVASSYAGVLTRLVQQIGSGKPPVIHGDGLQSRDFVHVWNAVDALMAAMASISLRPDALVCNVCTGTSHTVRDIAHLVSRTLGTGPPHLLQGPSRAGDIRHSCGDPTHMSKTLGVSPFKTLEEGLMIWLGQRDEVSKVS